MAAFPVLPKKKSTQGVKKFIHMGANRGNTPAPARSQEGRPETPTFIRRSPNRIKKAPSVRAGGRARFRREALSDKGRKRAHRAWHTGRVDEIATLFHAWKMGRARPTRDDFRAPVFSSPQVRLILFLLDVSDSMAETRKLARAWAERFLNEAYLRRDPVGIITVQGTSAKILVQPTTSLPFILHRLSGLEENGGTPLRQGIHLVERLIRQWRDRYQAIDLYILTDGRSTEPLEGSGVAKSLSLIHRFVRDTVVVNPVPKAAAFARAFATLIGARLLDPRTFLEGGAPHHAARG